MAQDFRHGTCHRLRRQAEVRASKVCALHFVSCCATASCWLTNSESPSHESTSLEPICIGAARFRPALVVGSIREPRPLCAVVRAASGLGLLELRSALSSLLISMVSDPSCRQRDTEHFLNVIAGLPGSDLVQSRSAEEASSVNTCVVRLSPSSSSLRSTTQPSSVARWTAGAGLLPPRGTSALP